MNNGMFEKTKNIRRRIESVAKGSTAEMRSSKILGFQSLVTVIFIDILSCVDL